MNRFAKRREVFLKAAGFAADTFASAEGFFDSPRDGTRCLILDVRLLGMTGIELQRRLLDIQSPWRSFPLAPLVTHLCVIWY